MYSSISEDLRQIRVICQQLAQSEQQNIGVLGNQPGFQGAAQHGTAAARQLQECVNLCNRIEYSIGQWSSQTNAVSQSTPFHQQHTSVAQPQGHSLIAAIPAAGPAPSVQSVQPVQPLQSVQSVQSSVGARAFGSVAASRIPQAPSANIQPFGGAVNQSAIQRLMQADRVTH